MYWFISASVGIAAKTMASRRHGFDILTGPEILHLFHMAMFRPGCFKLELRELRSVVYHPPVSNCRSSQIRSCPCSIFSGVSVPLARKRDTSPEIISDLDGRSLFKVHILTTCFAASIRAVASPHRCTAKSAPVPIGGGVEMCLNLRLIFGGPAQTEDDLSGSVPFGGNQVWLCRRR